VRSPSGLLAGVVATSLWPIDDLRLRTGDLELRLPDAADLAALAGSEEARLLMVREKWPRLQRYLPPVGTEGLELCLELFGVGSTPLT
jgi:hypothetical protein